MKKKQFIIEKHILIPKHTLCTEKEKQQILEKYNATTNEMPKILITDASIANMKIKVNDMVKVERKDSYVGKTNFYRVVING